MRKAPLLLLLLVLTGCASGPQDDPNAPNVAFRLEPEDAAPNAYMFNGPVNVRFALSMANTTNQLVKLTRIEIRTIGSGAYTIRPTSTQLNLDISPGQSMTVPLAIWGYSQGGHLASTEPVTIRAAAYLSSPTGASVRLFTTYVVPQ